MKMFKKITATVFAVVIVLSHSLTSSAAEVGTDSEKDIHGIYVSAYVAGTKNMMNEMISHIDETSINAVVIDVKNDEGNIVFDMDSELIDELGVEKILVKNMPGLIDTLHEHDVSKVCIIRLQT